MLIEITSLNCNATLTGALFHQTLLEVTLVVDQVALPAAAMPPLTAPHQKFVDGVALEVAVLNGVLDLLAAQRAGAIPCLDSFEADLAEVVSAFYQLVRH